MAERFLNKYRIPSARAAWWDYRKNGIYYVTICTKDRKHYFGEIAPIQTLHATSVMVFSDIGKIAHQFWLDIPSHFPFAILDKFVIMPNHVHGIIVINHDLTPVDRETLVVYVDPLHATDLHKPEQPEQPEQHKNHKMSKISPKTGSLSSVIRSFKSAVTNWCNKNKFEFEWQSRFYDRIIRNDDELWRIRKYIKNNPANWKEDRLPKRG